MYVSDGNNIDAITTSGTKTTFFAGVSTPFGLAVDSSLNLYEVDGGTGNIYKYSPSGTQSLFYSYSANNVTYNNLRGDAFDSSGNLYVANWESSGTNSVLDKITSGGVLTTFATFGSGDIIRGVEVDSSNNVYVADGTTSSIYKVSSSGLVTTFASGLGSITGLAFNPYGSLFCTDGTNIDQFSGTGVKSVYASGLASNLYDITFDSNDNLYATFGFGSGTTIDEITPGGTVSVFASGLSAPSFIEYSVTPEPSTWALMICGSTFLLFIAWQRKRKAARPAS